MVDTDKLLGIMAEQHVTQKETAKVIGCAPKTFYEKMAKKVFKSDEIEKMILFFDIKNPLEVFFAQSVT